MTSTMRPGQLTPNEFENAILEYLVSKEPSLTESIQRLHVLSREYTGVGSFTRFTCEGPDENIPVQSVDLDASIKMPGVPNGMGAVLFLKGGKPDCLEVFTYGDDTGMVCLMVFPSNTLTDAIAGPVKFLVSRLPDNDRV